MTLYPSGLLRDHPKMRSEEEVRRAIAGLSPKTAEPQARLVAARVDPYRVLSLFAGIGGFDLGLERTGGFKTVAFCEIDPFCQRVLSKHWPEVPIYGDVRELTAAKLGADGIVPDVICGGFPCQDISWAGNGGGLAGERSGLWSEYARLIGELRPQYVIVENVAALLERGMATVCGDLASLGYDAEWSIISACATGAPHMRRRVLIVAYPDSVDGRPRLRDTSARQERALQTFDGFEGSRARWRARLANPSELYGGADGLPDGMDRNHAIGNSIAPAVSELIGRAILARDAQALKSAPSLEPTPARGASSKKPSPPQTC